MNRWKCALEEAKVFEIFNSICVIVELFFATLIYSGLKSATLFLLMWHIFVPIVMIKAYFTRGNYCSDYWEQEFGIICLLSNLIPFTILTAVEIIVFHIGGVLGSIMIIVAILYTLIAGLSLLATATTTPNH